MKITERKPISLPASDEKLNPSPTVNSADAPRTAGATGSSVADSAGNSNRDTFERFPKTPLLFSAGEPGQRERIHDDDKIGRGRGESLGGPCGPGRNTEIGGPQASPQLDELAQRILPRATWDQLILPKPALEQLHALAAEASQRGSGQSALFIGSGDTGKTMAAEVLANELHLDLYRVDLSQVVSKYIGETEKNLDRLFAAAEGSGALLFFDESDALFGHRTEVKDSHDRYANTEINYLLQRLEGYKGLAILATNMKSEPDQAFLRHIRSVVHFPFP